MNKTRIFIIIATSLALIVTAASFIVLIRAVDESRRIEKLDKAKLIYSQAEKLVRAKDYDKAIAAFTAVISQYPDSNYTEKSLRSLASIYLKKGDYQKARYYNSRLIKDFPGIKDIDQVRSSIEEINIKMMQSPEMTEDSLEYKVQPGDTLTAISRKYNTTVELVKKMNGLRSDMIHVGQRLKINVSKFSILVDKSDNMLTLKKDGEPFKTYVISTGKDNSTPVGTFTIVDKMIKPPWTKPGVGMVMPDDPQYELGERWMPISIEGYGIHGTNDETSIGGQVTAGCVRMHNNDVIELYDMVPKGTEVEIVD